MLLIIEKVRILDDQCLIFSGVEQVGSIVLESRILNGIPTLEE